MTYIKAQCGQVSVGSSAKGGKGSAFAWFIWPEDLNSLEAIMHSALIGPFPNEDTARKASLTTVWEKVDG